MRWESPLFLSLLLFLILLWLFRAKWVRPLRLLQSALSVERANRDLRKQSWKIRLIIFLQIFFLAALIFALARPQMGNKSSHRKAQGIDILITLDVSASMNAEDMGEGDRLDAAKSTIEQFVSRRTDDRIGLVAFSGEAVTLTPPTLDYGLVLQQLRELQTGYLRDGTAIGDGLALAVQRLRSSQSKSKVVILLTDGESNIGQVDPITAGELASGYSIRVYTIAIGREGRVKVPIKRPGIGGGVVTAYQWYDNALNTELLEKIADETKGHFYRVTDSKTLESVFSEINRLEKTSVESKDRVRWEERFEPYLIIGLLLWIIERLLALFIWKVWVI